MSDGDIIKSKKYLSSEYLIKLSKTLNKYKIYDLHSLICLGFIAIIIGFTLDMVNNFRRNKYGKKFIKLFRNI